MPERVRPTRAAKERTKIEIMKTRSSRAKVLEGRRDRIAWVNAINWRSPKMPICKHYTLKNSGNESGTQGGHVFGSADWEEAYEGNLH